MQRPPQFYDDDLVTGLIKKVTEHGCVLTESEINRIKNLSDKNIHRLDFLVDELHQNQFLTLDTFNQALDAASKMLPSVEQSSCVKKKIRGFTKVTLDSKLTFFIPKGSSKQRTNRGSYGHVNGAFENIRASKPLWAVKWLTDFEIESLSAMAKHEVKYLRHAGFQAFYYATKKSVKIIMDWCEGERTETIMLSGKYYHAPFETRLKWCIELLSCLARLNEAFVTHGDAHYRNTYINTENNTATFIDFGSSKKLISSKKYFQYPDIIKFSKYHLEKDGIFATEWRDNSILKNVIKKLYSATSSHVYPNFTPCSIAQARDYCVQVLENLTSLDDEKLEKIAAATINRAQLTVHDVLHGNQRPKEFTIK